MKTIRPFSTFAKAGSLASALAFFTAASLEAQVVDPDPEIFDGTSTKTEETQQEQQPAVDDWEHANLIIYDSNEQGSQKGGMGRAGGQGPGMDMGSGSGMGTGVGLPLPMAGGGVGMGGSGLEIPEMPQGQSGGGGEENPEQTNAPGGGNPQGNQQGMGQAAGGGRQPPQKPGEVPIGDDSKRIASAGPQLPVGDTEGLKDAEDNNKGDGGDNTQMKAASGAQSGVRGGGVEQGDAMPSDL
ncbi:MAG: hypothetical protein ACREIA_15225 [Opitutaceae bacterium]